jgi:hypothetical protein
MTKTSELKIDDKTYQLGYNFNSIVEAEAAAQCNLLDAIGRLGSTTAAQLRGLLAAMIVPYPGLPQDVSAQLPAVGELIRMDTIGKIVAAMGEACALAASEELAEQYRAAMADAEPEQPATE